MRISRGVSLERAILDNGQKEGTTRASRRMLYIYLVGASLLRYQKCTMRIDCSYLQIPDNYPAYLDLQFGNIELHVAQIWSTARSCRSIYLPTLIALYIT